MKYIVTLYNSINFGAYMQAYCLKIKIEDICANSETVKCINTHSRFPLQVTLRKSIRSLLQFQFKETIFYLSRYIKFKKSLRSFMVCEKKVITNDDTVIFGSDEIWNVSRKEIADYPVFWGEGIKCRTKISYAPSMNNAQKRDIENTSIVNKLRGFDKISVRDMKSKKLLEMYLSNEVAEVIDPTMLLTKSEYKKYIKDVGLNKYILVYIYQDNFSQAAKKELIEFADSKGLQLVAINNYIKWCDINIPCTPIEALSYFYQSDFVVTNTFHGSIYSILFNKIFLTFVNASSKTECLLLKFGLKSRIIRNSDINISEKIHKEIDYDRVNQLLSDYRKVSINFLESALNQE